jgi:hypothetical protein
MTKDEKLEKIKKCGGNCFIGDNGGMYLTRCPHCKKENWALSVADGRCAWCGYDTGTKK